MPLAHKTKNVIGCIVLVLFTFLFSSCNHSLEKADYIHWVKNYENGLHVRKTSGVFIFDVQHEPVDYLFLRSNYDVQNQSLDLQYYTLNIELTENQDLLLYGVNDQAGKQQNLYYFSYLFQQDIYLEENSRKLPCVLFHFEQNDLAKARTFTLGFENPNTELADEALMVIDSPRFGSLPVKIKISKNNIPSLKL